MSVHATGGLSVAEIRQLEAQLRSAGFRPAPSDAWEIGPREYSVSRPEQQRPLTAPTQGYSICWRK